MKTAIVTLTTDSYSHITALTSPTQKAYADRIGAEFVIISTRKYPDVNICYEKFQLGDLLRDFERLIYLDGDTLVKPTAPDLFDVVPFGHWGAMDEVEAYKFWNAETIISQRQSHGWTHPWSGKHFNAGVMVMDKSHIKLFENPTITNKYYFDQPYFNGMVEWLKIPVCWLPKEYNFMLYHSGPQDFDRRQKAYILHFAGNASHDFKYEHIKAELAYWAADR